MTEHAAELDAPQFLDDRLAHWAETTPDGPIVAILGAVYHPFADELWLGGRDHPTTCNGVPVPPLVDAPPA